ncbi:hypothetical protein FG93_01173 [Bosea sp. LC85]|nr:hypothetical protein [Bosea sp. LC85]KFC74587.1 hypothetical protein FG93_01173 [Bosea sp. LC85]
MTDPVTVSPLRQLDRKRDDPPIANHLRPHRGKNWIMSNQLP